MNNAFDGLVSRLDIAEERIDEPEDTSIETYQVKSKEKKKKIEKERNRLTKKSGTTTKSVHRSNGNITWRTKIKEQKKNSK